MTIRILLLDDEPNVSNAITRILRQDWRDAALIEPHTRGTTALARSKLQEFDVVVSDYRMPEMDGIEFLTEFRKLQPLTSRIILSGTTDFDMLMTAINETAILRFISKPWDDLELQQAVRLGVETTQRNREAQKLAEPQPSRDDPAWKQQEALNKLEALEPGITKVRWGPNGEVLLEDD